MNIGIIKEGKTPQDRRVPLTPTQCKLVKELHPEVDLTVQPSPHRCYSDTEYQMLDVRVDENMENCDVLLGVKEVPLNDLISNKTYFIFSHTIKKQTYNRNLLRAAINKNIRLVDWECLKNKEGQRVIAFGRWAGIVGAYNGLLAWGERSGDYSLTPMHMLKDFDEAKSILRKLEVSNVKTVLTGDGRVGMGACETLDCIPIRKLPPSEYLKYAGEEAVYTQLSIEDMYHNPASSKFDLQHYFTNPEQYESKFEPFSKTSDLMINGIYWDERVPKFFSQKDMRSTEFRIKTIADITCDIAPESSIPSTIRSSEISDPIYGYDVDTGEEVKPYAEKVIDVMAVDNLPNELPRDASSDFGKQFIDEVLPELLKTEKSEMIYEATICRKGKLNEPFKYLWDYVHEGG